MVSSLLPEVGDDAFLVSLAREVAINIKPLDDVLKVYGLSFAQWESLRDAPRFTTLVEQHLLEWEAAKNTHERTKIKAAVMIEGWLPEAWARLHDQTENLNAKTELAKLVTRIAGMGLDRVVDAGAGGEKITVTINLGAGGDQLKFEQNFVPKVIDAAPND
jgi:hypothetical protein